MILIEIQLGILLGIASLLFSGVGDFLSAYSSKNATPMRALAWIRIFAVALLILLSPFFLGWPQFSTNSIIIIIIAGGIYAIAGWAYLNGLSKGDVSIVSPIASTYPIFTIALSIIFLGEILTSNQIIAIAIAILGSVMASFKLKDMLRLNRRKLLAGVDYALITSITWGAVLFLIGVLAKSLGWYSPTAFIYLASMVYLLIYFKSSKKNISMPKRRVLLFVFFVALLDLLSFFTYTQGTLLISVAIVAAISSLYPIVTVSLARIFFREKLDINQVFGIALVLLGITLLLLYI